MPKNINNVCFSVEFDGPAYEYRWETTAWAKSRDAAIAIATRDALTENITVDEDTRIRIERVA